MARKSKAPKVWKFTLGRREALKSAQKEHARLVELGKRARAKGMR